MQPRELVHPSHGFDHPHELFLLGGFTMGDYGTLVPDRGHVRDATCASRCIHTMAPVSLMKWNVSEGVGVGRSRRCTDLERGHVIDATTYWIRVHPCHDPDPHRLFLHLLLGGGDVGERLVIYGRVTTVTR